MKKTNWVLSMALAVLLAVGMLPMTAATALAAVGDSFADSASGLKFTVLTEDAAAKTGTVEVAKGGYTGTSYDIPATVKNGGITYTVTAIGYEAFQRCTTLLSITIPDTVTVIKDYAFFYCSSLSAVEIPNGVTSIGMGAFFHCEALKEVTIPESVENLGGAPFRFCKGLTEVNILGVCKGDGYGEQFADCTDLTSVSIGSKATNIFGDMFSDCTNLQTVTIPTNITVIGFRAFADCTALKEVFMFYDDKKVINNAAFEGVEGLKIQHILTWPSNISVNGNVVSWDAVGVAESYDVLIFKDNQQIKAVNTKDTSLDVSADLQGGGEYYFGLVSKREGYTASSANYTNALNAYSVRFDMMGRGTAIGAQTILDGGKVAEPTAPAEAGYVFGGWYKEAACKTAWDFASDAVKNNVTLYAQWTLCDHSGSTDKPDCRNEATCSVCNGMIEKAAHTFTAKKHDDVEHWTECSVCDAEQSGSREKHSGGTASCTEKAKCAGCGEEYGDAPSHGESEIRQAKPASCEEEGYTGDKHCKTCGEKMETGTAIAKTAHTYEDGQCTLCGAADPDYVADLPKTGDDSRAILWACLMAASACGAAVLLCASKTRKSVR